MSETQLEKKVIFGGSIITMDDKAPHVEAVGVEGEKIVAVGSIDEVKKKMDGDYITINLNGKCLLPGFIDSHLHPIAFLFFLFNLDLKDIHSYKELKLFLKNAVTDKPQDKLIIGLSLHEEEFEDPKERVLPTKWDLDEACPDHSVFLMRYDGHMGVANSKALELANITNNTPSPEGGEIRRNEKGEITGQLTELAASVMLSFISMPTPDIMNEVVKKGFDIFASKGITSFHGILQAEAGAEMGDAGALELPIFKSIMNQIPQNWYSLIYTHNPKKLKRFKKPPLDGGKLDSKFKVGCHKLFADGTYGSATALMFEPFSDQPDKSGFMVVKEKELYEMMKVSHNLGFQIGIHTIGDKGNRVVVDLYKKLLTEFPRENHRHRIEHASSLTEDVIRDMSQLGIIAACQPPFINSEYTWLPKRLGVERCKEAYPMKSLVNAGVIICSGSDCPIEDPDVIMGLHALVTRNGFIPEQCISILDALKTYTINAAYASFEEDVKGTIKEGKLADLVILNTNPLECKPEEIKDLQIIETIIRGKTVYKRD